MTHAVRVLLELLAERPLSVHRLQTLALPRGVPLVTTALKQAQSSGLVEYIFDRWQLTASGLATVADGRDMPLQVRILAALHESAGSLFTNDIAARIGVAPGRVLHACRAAEDAGSVVCIDMGEHGNSERALWSPRWFRDRTTPATHTEAR